MREVNGRAALPPFSLGKKHVKTGAGTEKQFFDIGPVGLLHSTPFINGHENRSFYAPASDDLRTLLESRVKKLAKPGLRLL
jgi:hypothetical protein